MKNSNHIVTAACRLAQAAVLCLSLNPAWAQGICATSGGANCDTALADFAISDGTPDLFFFDTDVGQPDWQVRINEGGVAKFTLVESNPGPSFIDPLIIDGGARNNAVRIAAGGRIGFGTATPAQELHIVDAGAGFGPAIHFQDNNGQDWELEADDGSFAVFDVTHSKRPMQIVPDAPTNSLYIDPAGRVGLGTGPTEELHVFRFDNANTIIRAENSNAAGSSAASAIQSKADVAQVSFQSHGSGRTISRFGKTLGGWNEMLGVLGNGFIIGTLFDKPLIFGTNNKNRLEITPSGDVVHFSAGTVHPDYVFEPSYELESIEDHARSMWSSKYLPGVGAGKYAADGRAMFKLGAGRAGMLEELEKAHIYIDQLNERVRQAEADGAAKEARLAELEDRLQRLEELLR